jgi:hypothetical protein
MPMAEKKELSSQIAVRIDDELREALAEDAEKNGRTIAQSIRFLLRDRLAEAS